MVLLDLMQFLCINIKKKQQNITRVCMRQRETERDKHTK